MLLTRSLLPATRRAVAYARRKVGSARGGIARLAAGPADRAAVGPAGAAVGLAGWRVSISRTGDAAMPALKEASALRRARPREACRSRTPLTAAEYRVAERTDTSIERGRVGLRGEGHLVRNGREAVLRIASVPSTPDMSHLAESARRP